jgi:hypothetical protein
MKLFNKKLLLVLTAALLVVAMSTSLAMADPAGTQPQQSTNPESTQQLQQPRTSGPQNDYPYGYNPRYGTANPDFQPNWNMWGHHGMGMGGCW